MKIKIWIEKVYYICVRFDDIAKLGIEHKVATIGFWKPYVKSDE